MKPFPHVLSLGLGIVLGLLILFLATPQEKVKFDEFAGGQDGRWVTAKWNGQRIHCNATHFGACQHPQGVAPGKVAHLYGASQVHTVRYYKEGDQPLPYFLKNALPDIGLGVMSEPNLNFQELYVFYKSLDPARLPDVIVIPLVIDDLKEEGLRDGIRTMLFAKAETDDAQDEYVWTLRERYKSSGLSRTTALINFESNDFRGFRKTASIQNYVEGRLEGGLDKLFSFTDMREQLMGNATILFRRLTTRPMETVRTQIHTFFGFSGQAMAVEAQNQGSTEGKRTVFLDLSGSWLVDIPPSVYDANFAALKALVTDAHRHGVNVAMYYQPRPQAPRWPYAAGDILRFRKEVNDLCREQACTVYDLENLVPDAYFGTEERNGRIVMDMFHFDIRGHELLGASVAAIIRRELEK